MTAAKVLVPFLLLFVAFPVAFFTPFCCCDAFVISLRGVFDVDVVVAVVATE